MSRARPLALIGPGLLIAATGVGAGDLATAGFAGARLGTTVLWAVVLGAALKYALNEGIARWQLATGTTVIEGVAARLGRIALLLFLLYLIPWAFFTGGALVSACGVATQALLPEFGDPQVVKILFGAGLSAAGVALALRGGFLLFERVMALCIGLMFVAVVIAAALVAPDPAEIARGLLVPTLPPVGDEAFGWTAGLLGGVGGTVTLLCYGTWIRDAGRRDLAALRLCRIDLAVGYGVTALFGIAMVVIAARIGTVPGRGAALVVALGDELGARFGSGGRLLFLLGAWAAMVSSLLGVWEAIPRVFEEAWCRLRGAAIPERSGRAARIFLLLLATVPILQALRPFAKAQRWYALVGAWFLPLLAIALLLLNGRRAWIGPASRNGPAATAGLALTLLVFAGWALLEMRARLG